MTRIFIFSFLTFFILTELKGQKVEVSGKVIGISDSAALKIYFLPLIIGEDVIVKEVICKNGKFNIITELKLPMWHLVRIDCPEFNKTKAPDLCKYQIQLDIFFFLQPGDKIRIHAIKELYGVNFVVHGNKIAKQQNAFRKSIFKLEQSYAELINSKFNLNAAYNIDKEIEKTKAKIDCINLVNIRKHTDWEISAIKLQGYEKKIVQEVYNKLNRKIKESFFGKYLLETNKLLIQ